ncbi:hypothetical protein [Nocardioides aurantiacus]|uniref:Uncharacterized protein n=1 Tax=Nocardioides aurantiacus TaxID=86796 RepID=A0A3N2CS81_9ACTN|nr:hypothetical protein [Nocardioides aurantiacus]ROR90389.1 hypothetical protein EDD33_1229 [Nocardioides aurantiacus]
MTEDPEDGRPDDSGTPTVPGWVLHPVDLADHAESWWLYHHADGTFEDEDGYVYEPDPAGVLVPVDAPAPTDPPGGPSLPLAGGERAEKEAAPPDTPVWGALPVADPDRRREPVLPPALVLISVSVAALAVVLMWVVVSRWPDQPTPASATTPLQVPAAVAPDSEYVRSQVLPSGDIRVDHWISTSRPITRVELGLPPGPGGGPVAARQVRVATDTGPWPGPTAVTAAPSAYEFGAATEVQVSYVLSGAVTRSDRPSGRALARLTSLDLSYPGGQVPRTVVVEGGRLLSAACATDQTVTPRPCGQSEGRAWRVRLEPAERTDLVMAQLDLA